MTVKKNAPKKVEPVEQEAVEPETAASAAAAEANGATPDTLVFTWRGVEFGIPRDLIDDVRVRFAFKSRRDDLILSWFLSSDPDHYWRFLSVVQAGEDEVKVMTEFFEAFHEASNQGNS